MGGSAMEMIVTVSVPPATSVPVTVATRLPRVSGSNEKRSLPIFSSFVASPAANWTSWVRSVDFSQSSSWVRVTVTVSVSVVAPVRVKVYFRSSTPPPMLSCSASMVTGIPAPARVTVTV